jgi:hypothetical protein
VKLRRVIAAAALFYFSGCGHSHAGPADASQAERDASATRVYIDARYDLIRERTRQFGTARVAVDALVTGVSDGCKGVLRQAPRSVAFGNLNGEVLLAPITAGDQIARAAVARFLARVAPLRWSNQRLTSIVRRLLKQEQLVLAVTVPAICDDLRAWVAKGFHEIPEDARRALDKIQRVDTAHAQMLKAIEVIHTKGCRPIHTRRPLEVCSRTTPTRESSQGDLPTYEPAPAATWTQLESYASEDGRKTSAMVRRLENALAFDERALYSSAGARLTRELGLDVGVLKLFTALGSNSR